MTKLVSAVVLMECSFVGMAAMDLVGFSVPVYLVLHAVAFGAYLVCMKSTSAMSPRLIFLIAVLFRITFMASIPALSDDIYRYIWDGRIASAGYNPFSHAPSDPDTLHLQDELWEKVAHRDIKTIYPPFAQACFMAVDAIHHSVYSFKLFFIACDLLLGLMIFKLLRTQDVDSNRVAAYLWNPLVVVEVAWSGHLEPLAMLFMMAGLYFYMKKKDMFSGLALALGASAKLLPVLILPLTLFRKRWKIIPVFLVLFVTLYIPFLSAGESLISGLGSYTEHWRYNDSLFHIFARLCPTLRFAKYLSLSVLCIIIVYMLLKKYNDPIKFLFIALATMFMMSPTVHPWYILWIAVFLPFFRLKSMTALTGLIPLSYWTLANYKSTGIWEESMVVKLLEYLPFYLLLMWEGYAHFKKKPSEKSESAVNSSF